jgi:hypothetical protein
LVALDTRRIRSTYRAGLCLAIAATLAAGACRDRDRADPRSVPIAATKYWEQPDSVVIGLGDPSDVKALTRDNVWVADRAATTIFSLTPGD